MNNRLVPFLLPLLLFCSCSLGDRTVDAGASFTLINLSNDYLVAITKGDTKVVNSLILWKDFLSKQGNNITVDKFNARLESMSGKWDPHTSSNHPLLGFSVKEVKYKADVSKVILQKDTDNADEISEVEIDFQWIGSGWVVIDDNLFGDNEIIQRLTGV